MDKETTDFDLKLIERAIQLRVKHINHGLCRHPQHKPDPWLMTLLQCKEALLNSMARGSSK